MANYPQELAQDAVCQSHTGHMTGLWFPPRPSRLNTNELMNKVGHPTVLPIGTKTMKDSLRNVVFLINPDARQCPKH